ncbi:MAG: FAD-binding oxidoreductase [Synechococcaceae bacterium WB4_1_0192]|nr:FAD-binding oxidoreductase [Synechococcaceae bacterium WB4_1_0192]
MIRPDPSELQELVHTLHRQGAPWLPAGLGSRLHWGPSVQTAPTETTPLVLSTARLDRLIEHCAGDFTVTVQAGMPLQQLQADLARQRQWLAIDWPWGSGPTGENSGSIGGLVARGLAGGLRQRYLGVRDQLIGIGIVRADGTAARAGGKVVKNVAGYDLMRLFTGSWGSLGLISELTLRTFPQPPQRSGLLLQGPLPALEALRRRCLSAPLMPQRLDWWSGALNGGAADGATALLLSLVSISGEAIREQLSDHLQAAEAAGLEAQQLDADALAALEARGRGGEADWLLHLGVLPARGAELVSDPALSGIQLSLAAGSGQGLAWASTATLPTHRVVQLRRRCEELGGQLNVLMQPAGAGLLAWGDAPARPLIEALKRQFDPRQQLARGRLPGVAAQGSRSR